MVITWYGEGCFKIQSSDTSILVDPLESSSGLMPPRFKADLTLVTQSSFANGDFPSMDIVGPGEYEVKNIEVSGVMLEADKTAYILKAEDMRLGFLGHVANKALPPVAAEKIAGVDILFIPGGGSPYIDQETAAKLIKQIDPRIVVASFFKIPGLKRKSNEVKDFLNEMDQKAEPQDRLTIKKKDLPVKRQVVVLKRV
ncbi:MAG: MBL fold metallo-hydrolase [bacterium]|nr:MBL fold metallo-hydrolase [bacterium]